MLICLLKLGSLCTINIQVSSGFKNLIISSFKTNEIYISNQAIVKIYQEM